MRNREEQTTEPCSGREEEQERADDGSLVREKEKTGIEQTTEPGQEESKTTGGTGDGTLLRKKRTQAGTNHRTDCGQAAHGRTGRHRLRQRPADICEVI